MAFPDDGRAAPQQRAEFAKTMEARKDWEDTTWQARHDALAAHTEYVRRHPDTDLPPLKSAEPSAHTEEEQAQLHAPAETDESRALIAAMTERTRAANEEIASLAKPGSAPRGRPRMAGIPGMGPVIPDVPRCRAAASATRDQTSGRGSRPRGRDRL